jgi:hypothetical protein
MSYLFEDKDVLAKLTALGPSPKLSPKLLPAPIRPLEGPIKGTFLSRTKGDIIIEAQQRLNFKIF